MEVLIEMTEFLKGPFRLDKAGLNGAALAECRFDEAIGRNKNPANEAVAMEAKKFVKSYLGLAFSIMSASFNFDNYFSTRSACTLC